MKAKRITGCLAAALLLSGCFEEVSYKTDYILKPMSKQNTGDPSEPIEGAQAYTYNVDTTLWTVASYEDALAGVVSLKENPAERMTAPAAVAVPYEREGAAGWLQMRLKRSSQMVVVVDPARKIYAYTRQELSENVPQLFVSVLFEGWKEGFSYASGKWSFYNQFYKPPIALDCFLQPEVQIEEGGASAPIASGKVTAYAVEADTTAWYIASYADAAGYTVTSKSDPEVKRSATFRAYKESDSDLYKMQVADEESPLTLMVVVVDEADRIYAYTQKSVDLTGASPTYPVLFRPWLGAWIAEEDGWCFVDESRAPDEGSATSLNRPRR